MARAGFSAMFVIALTLSQHAHAVGDDQAKAPLTAAGEARCEAQRTQFN
jgi:hypothetical protein